MPFRLQLCPRPSRTKPMRPSSTLTLRPVFFLVLFAASLWLSPSSRGAATLTVSPTSISNTYPGSVTLQISGLTNGETVLVERFLDANRNGTVDAGELLVQSFKVTDGQVTAFGGVRDANVPGDEDGAADGQISTAFYFSASPEFGRVAGNYVFRLSSPTGRFTPVVQSLSVTPAA